jgi:amino acid transporter
MATVEQGHTTTTPDGQFRRRMSLQAAMFIGVGGQIGSGWLFAVLAAAGIAGPSAIFSWLIGGALTMLIALAWMEVGTSIPVSGAIVRYPYLSNGGLAGWILGLSYWLANVSLPAIEAVAALTYLGGLFPRLGLLTTRDGVSMLSWPNGIAFGVLMMIAFLAINLFGVKLLSEANRWVTWWKIIVPTLTFLLLLFAFHRSNVTDLGFFGNPERGGAGSMLEAVAASGIAFALMGFRGVIDFGGEVTRPSRNIPLGTVGCVVIPLAVYLGLQIAFLGAIDWTDAGVPPGDWVALASSPWANGPLAAALHASGYALLGAFVSVLLLDAILSPGAAGYLYLGSGARVGFGLAVNGFFPKALTRMNQHGVPAVSAVVSFTVGCLFFLPAPSWYRLVGFISSALVLSTLAASVALVVLRRTAPSLPRTFRLPAAAVFAPSGFAAATLIIYWCGFVTLFNLVTILLGGMALYAVCFSCQRGWTARVPSAVLAVAFLVPWAYVTGRSGFLLAPNNATVPGGGAPTTTLVTLSVLCAAFLGVLHLISPAEGRQHLRGGYWVVGLLLALLGICAIGEYGPMATPLLSFPLDTVSALLVGLLAYYWAVHTGFTTPEVAALEAEPRC